MAVERADLLASVAADDAVAEGLAEWLVDLAAMFDRQIAQATAADYFKFILTQMAEKLPELVLSAPLFDGALYKIKCQKENIAEIIGGLNEIATQQVEKFCKMAADIGSGESWQEAVQNTFVFDNQ